MGTINLVKAGMLTTVQDLGRSDLQHLGVPASGPMDILAAKVANILVGNEDDAAVLECTYSGPVIEFSHNTTIAIAGAKTIAKLNGYDIDNYLSIAVQSGDIIDLSTIKSGMRVYLAVAGGIKTDLVLGSRATYLPMQFGKDDKKLKDGDSLPIEERSFNKLIAVKDNDLKFIKKELYEIRIVKGPQAEYFEESIKQMISSSIYKMSPNSNRMGVRFEGKKLITTQSDMISDGIPLGSVQITRGGQPIIMMADRQPTGGYPKIAKVIKNDIPIVAQLRPGDSIKFKWISLEDSNNLYMSLSDKMDDLKKRICKEVIPHRTYRVFIQDKLFQTSIYEK